MLGIERVHGVRMLRGEIPSAIDAGSRWRCPMALRSAAAFLAALTTLTVAGVAAAQTYPTRPIRIVVGYSPGGPTDIFARLVAQKLGEAWGQTVVVENRPGAATNIAAEAVARAAPDGYTLFTPTLANAINVTLYGKLNYDIVNDFAHVSNMVLAPDVGMVHPSVPARNVRELFALARARPGELRNGSSGVGSPSHLEVEMIKTLAGVKMTHVPYKGAAPVLTDLVAGHIECYFGGFASALPFIQAKRVRPIAVTGLKRVAIVPDVPTLDEQGFKGFEMVSWFGISAPAGTPREIVARLNAEIVRAVNSPEMRERLGPMGATVVGDTPEQFTAFVRREVAKMAVAVRQSGAKPE
jgi:tripartite-type tricarboxylate transporter receptor subunit TctC